ncbi:MAG: DUF4296 domain-containing protein [Flavobacteriales bacterium]|nr:DUF4296 domain-containing protein [Flavobacteriales bacterium]
MNSLRVLACLIVVLSLFGCAKKRTIIPDDVLGKEEFAALLTDIRLAESNAKLIRTKGNIADAPDSLYFLIFRQHNIDREDARRSLDWYSDNPEILKEVDQMVLENLNRLR